MKRKCLNSEENMHKNKATRRNCINKNMLSIEILEMILFINEKGFKTAVWLLQSMQYQPNKFPAIK